MVCGACAGYGHSSSYVHIDHLSHGLGSYDGGYDNYDDHDYHVSYLNYSNIKKKLFGINFHGTHFFPNGFISFLNPLN